jgi:hypothetical protein
MWKRIKPIMADWTARIIFSFASGTVIEVCIAGLTLRQSLTGRVVALPVIIALATPYRLYRNWLLKKFRVVEAPGILSIFKTYIAGRRQGKRVVLDAAGIRKTLKKHLAETLMYMAFYLAVYMVQLRIVGATWRQIATACISLALMMAPLGIPFGWLQDFVTHKVFRIPKETSETPPKA